MGSTEEAGRREAQERRRAREALLADRAQAAQSRARRRVGLRPPATMPVPEEPAER